MLFRVILPTILLALTASFGACDTVVFQEDFSGPFVEHDWVYNNSGGNNANGYGGVFWPCKVDSNGQQILGYEPTVYYYSFFDSSPFNVGDLSNVDGWTGSGQVSGASSHTGGQSLFFSNQGAYRNVTGGMQRTVQWVQCYMKVSNGAASAFLYIGTTDAAAASAVVRFNGSGKIQALNGNGSGAGTWTDIAGYVANAWYRVRVKIDYSTSKWEVSVDRSVVLKDLGFRDSAASSLNSVKFEHSGGGGLYVDDLYTGNGPYAVGRYGSYWSDQYNAWCVDYDSPLNGAYDTYDWMNCPGANTDPFRASCFKAAAPDGWTAAFGMWGDPDPASNAWFTKRGKMGFGPLMGPYAQSPDNRCLHAFSAHGDMRIASPAITTGPGVYTLSWKGGVWNGNTADPAKQYKWTDWCQWGFGYTNWCAWDGDPITTPPYDDTQTNQISVHRFWVWQKNPFHDSDPDGVDPNVGDAQHPAGEEPGMWHSYARTFAFGYPPAKGDEDYDYNQEPGCFIGFNIGHGHDLNNQGYRWATILNVDDIVLTKKDPISLPAARNLPINGLLELADMVVVNMVPFKSYDNWDRVDVFLETKDRTGGIMLRVSDPYQVSKLWNGLTFAYNIGDVVNVVGAISQDDYYDNRNPQPDSRNPVKYIAGWLQGSRLPAIVPKQETAEVKPVALSGRNLIGAPVTAGLPTDGMLVTIFGRVNSVDLGTNTFYVDDGSGLVGYSGGQGVKVDGSRSVAMSEWLTLPDDGSYVTVTGTITAEKALNHSTIVRTLYLRSATDIQQYFQ